MITFEVVREQNGWAVRAGERMTMPFRSRDIAVKEAHFLADAIRRHGQSAQVIVEPAPPRDPPSPSGPAERPGIHGGADPS